MNHTLQPQQHVIYSLGVDYQLSDPGLCHRDPVYAGGGSGSGRSRLRQRRAALQPPGTDAQDSIQPNVLH